MKVAFSGGEREVNVGDKVTFYTGDSWEVVRHATNGMYSPSGFGGTPGFACKSLDAEIPDYLRKYVEDDGTVIFCGDSIAAAMKRTELTKPADPPGSYRDATGELVIPSRPSPETGECPNCFEDKTVTMSDGSKRPCELCAEVAACPDCGMRPAIDGMWHKPGCASL